MNYNFKEKNMDFSKRYKPGQLITVERKVYRVKKAKLMLTCLECIRKSKGYRDKPCDICVNNLPIGCYLIKVYPKDAMG